MKEYRIEIESAAWEDLEEIFQWIARDSPDSANRWYNRCLKAIHSLSQFPERYHLAPESIIFHEMIRHLVYGNYRVIFRIKEDSVEILHVRHGARRHVLPDSEAP